jgi:hypothetical protein
MKTITITKGINCKVIKNDPAEKMGLFKIEGPEEMEASDGYHTFGELYEHRITLFIALCRLMAKFDDGIRWTVWRSKRHSDGELAFGGTWFVLGIHEAEGYQITYHLPIKKWKETKFAETFKKAPEFDGHTPEDVLKRLKAL